MSVTSQRYSEAVSTAVCIALMLLTSSIAVAQGPLQPSGGFLSGLKHRLSPENMLPYRDTTPRQPLSRQPPPGQNSWNVELVGMTGGAVYDVAVQGNIAYCATGAGLMIFDVSSPAAPRILGTLITPESATGVAVSYPYAYVTCYTEGLCIIDISAPSRPVLVGRCDTPGAARKVAISGSYAYIAYIVEHSGGMQVIDISDKRAPRAVASLRMPDVALDVFVSGSLVYVAAGTAGLRIVDVSNPTAPRAIGYFDPDTMNARGVQVVGRYAYVAGGSGVWVVDVSHPQEPSGVGVSPTPGVARRIFVQDSIAYVACGAAGMRVLDISNPGSLREVAFVADRENDAWSVFVSGSSAYIANGYLGLHMVDVSRPSDPRPLGAYPIPGSVMGLSLSGMHACTGGLVAGLRLVDIANPAHPREISRRKLSDWVWGVATSGAYAYAAAWEHGLRILDISRPLNPVEVGYVDTPGFAVGISVAGNYAYVADGASGLRVIDIRDPFAPREVGFCDTPDEAFDVFLSGSYAYVADIDGGLRIIDVSNPSSPREIGFLNTWAVRLRALGVYVSGSYAYVAGGSGGLRVVDISDPTHPREVGYHLTAGSAWHVVVVGALAYVADGEGGLRVFDVSDPYHPIEVGYFDTPGSAVRLSAEGNLVYLTNIDAGLFILRYTGSIPNHPPRVPTLLAPDEDETVTTATPTFRLKTEDVDGDRVKFEIQMVKGDDTRTFSTDFVTSGEEATISVPAGQALTAGQWSWRARATDDKGAVSGWSAMRRLNVNINTPPAVPTLIAPVNGATVSTTPSLTLSSSDPDGERVKLEIQVSHDAETRIFTIDYVDSGKEAVCTIPADQPLAEGSWSWKARAVDERGAESGWSEAWSFTVAVNRAPAVPTLIAPPPNAVVTPTPTFRLRTEDPGGDRVKFVIRLSRDAEVRTIITGFVNSGADATHTVPSSQPLSQGRWSWKARAIDEQGAESGWSAPQEFIVRIDKPDLVPSEVSVSSPKAMTGGVVTISVRVTNRGDAPASSSRTRVQLSRSADAPSTSDRVLTEFLTPALEVNQAITHESQVIIPTDVQPGEYTIWVTVDADRVLDQSDRNNDRGGVALRIVPSTQVWLSAGVNTFGVSTSAESLAPGSIGLSGVAMKRWEPGAGYLDVSEEEPLQVGKAYWVRTPRSIAIRVPAEASAQATTIRLQQGWNLIASPYPSTVPWSLDLLQVRVGVLTVSLEQAQQSGWMESYAWGWKQDAQNPDAGHYVFIYDANVLPGVQGYLEPWKGYWVYARQGCDLLLPSDTSDETRSTRPLSSTSKGWALRVWVRQGDSEAEAIVGVSANGRGLNVAPPPAPPATGGKQPVEVWVERADVLLGVDVRGSLGTRQEWNLLVRFGEAREEVSLRWQGANRLPRDVSLMLIDQTTGARRSLRTAADYRFLPAEGETQRRFVLIAERHPDFPLRIVGLRASRTRQAQITGDAAAGCACTVQFALSRMAIVQAEVLNAAGQRVAVLDAGSARQAGQHTLVWRGVDMTGRALPAGVYLVRVQAQDEEGRRTQAVAPLVLVR